MSLPRTEFAISTHAGLIYTFGGTTGTTVQMVEAYNPASNTWTSCPSMPTARQRAVAATLGDKIYVVGGFRKDSQTGSVVYTNVTEVYDPIAKTWATKAPPPLPAAANSVLGNQFIAGAALGGMLYLAIFDSGGNGFLAYDPIANIWTPRIAPAAQGTLSATALGGSFFLMQTGWSMGSGGQLSRYDPALKIWVNLPSLFPATTNFARRECAALAAAKGTLLAIGGLEHDYSQPVPQLTARVDAFEPAGGAWKGAAPLPRARHSVGTAIVGDTVYVLGGSTSNYCSEVVPVDWVESLTLP